MIPFCLVDRILKFSGAYHWNEKERPYIRDLRMLENILPAHGVRASVTHLKEYHVLKRAYHNHVNNPLYGFYPDACHLLV